MDLQNPWLFTLSNKIFCKGTDAATSNQVLEQMFFIETFAEHQYDSKV